MKVPLYDIKSQYQEQSAEINAAVHKVISSGVYTIAGGTECAAFEAEVQKYHGIKHAISLNSGTDALRILMDSLNIGKGDEVITASFTFVASVETIVQTGATPVFAEIDPDTYCLSPESIERAITPRTKAILPVHLFGQMADMGKIQKIAEKHGLLILEDAAQAMGSTQEGVFAGNFSLGAGLSFYPTKNLGAAGDAGMIITNDDAVAERCRSIRVHGMGRERYYYDDLGYTSRMDEVQATVLRIKLRILDKWTSLRQDNAKIYLEHLEGTGIKLPITFAGNNHTWHQFSILTEDREELQSYLRAKEIDSGVYYPVPIHLHKPYQHCIIGPDGLTITERVSKQILALPIQPHLSVDQVEFVADAICEFQQSRVKATV